VLTIIGIVLVILVAWFLLGMLCDYVERHRSLQWTLRDD
jgi:hypothetical protein